jgi:putative membrane protein
MIEAHMWMDGWGWLFGFAWIAFWALLIVVIVALLRSRPGSPSGHGPAAIRILEERYARGEIPREEFLERRAVLRGEQGPSPAEG